MDYCIKSALALLVMFQFLARSSGQIGSTIYMEEAKSIFETIFPTYNKDVPPRNNYPEPIIVDLTADVMHLSDLDVMKQILTSTIDLSVMWKDTRLGWNPQNVNEITVDKTMVWRPKISISNAVDKSVEVEAPDLVLKSSGEIEWFRRLLIKTSCPNDQANKTTGCDIVFSTGIHLESKLSDFGNVTDETCSTSVTSHKMWDVAMAERDTEDEVANKTSREDEGGITCTVLLKKKPGCCSQTAAHSGDTKASTNLGSPIELSGLILLFTIMFQCIFAHV